MLFFLIASSNVDNGSRRKHGKRVRKSKQQEYLLICACVCVCLYLFPLAVLFSLSHSMKRLPFLFWLNPNSIPTSSLQGLFPLLPQMSNCQYRLSLRRLQPSLTLYTPLAVWICYACLTFERKRRIWSDHFCLYFRNKCGIKVLVG